MTIDQAARIRKAHDDAVDRALSWARAAALGHKTERPFHRWEDAELKFADILEDALTARKPK